MKHSKLFALVCMLAVIIGLCASGSARAGLFAKKQTAAAAPAAPVMLYPVQDEESFQAVAKSFHKIPFNDPQLEFNILLPKDWTSEETVQADAAGNLNRQLISELARFESPVINTMRVDVTVQSMKLEHEISAEHWLQNYILTNGCELQDKITALDDKRALAHCVAVTDGKSLFVDVKVHINGNNAVVVRFETPLPLKDSMAFLAKKSLESFRFILETAHTIETQKIFSFADSLKFSYPESWAINHMDVKDSRSMSMQLYGKTGGDKVDGLIRFVVIKRGVDTSLKKEAAELKKSLTDVFELDFKKLISSGKAPASDHFLFSRYEVYQVAGKKEDSASQELHLAVLGDKDWYVFAFLLTPSENDNFYIWACNTQTFNMIIKSLR